MNELRQPRFWKGLLLLAAIASVGVLVVQILMHHWAIPAFFRRTIHPFCYSARSAECRKPEALFDINLHNADARVILRMICDTAKLSRWIDL